MIQQTATRRRYFPTIQQGPRPARSDSLPKGPAYRERRETAERIRAVLRGNAQEPAVAIPDEIQNLPSAVQEAAHLLLLLDHGSTADELRDLIRVTPHQTAILHRLTIRDPIRRRTVDLMINWRNRVLLRFEEGLAARGNQVQNGADRSDR